MDAIVLVGGQGTRLRPLTARRHKSLVPVRNRPAIEHLFAWLEASGFERAILAIGRFNDDLADAYRHGRLGKMRVELVEETERLESGGAIRNAVQLAGIRERFVVCNGDVFVDFPFQPALDEHLRRHADLTIALYPVDEPSMYGVAALDETDAVTGFVEKPPPGMEPSNLVNAGVWIFDRHLVDEIPPGAVRVEETLFPSLVARRRMVLGHRLAGIWADIGTPARYLALNLALLTRDNTSDTAEADVSPTATVRLSSLGAGTSLANGANVDSSILWERVTVGANASIKDSVVADGVTIGEGARLVGAVVGAGATIPPGAQPPAGTVVEAGETFGRKHD